MPNPESPQQPPLWRSDDPPSSAAAAIDLSASGRREAQKRVILAALVDHPGATASELAARLRLDAVQIRKRLPDLEHDGLASPGPTRRGLVRLEQTWYPTGGTDDGRADARGESSSDAIPESREQAGEMEDGIRGLAAGDEVEG